MGDEAIVESGVVVVQARADRGGVGRDGGPVDARRSALHELAARRADGVCGQERGVARLARKRGSGGAQDTGGAVEQRREPRRSCDPPRRGHAQRREFHRIGDAPGQREVQRLGAAGAAAALLERDDRPTDMGHHLPPVHPGGVDGTAAGLGIAGVEVRARSQRPPASRSGREKRQHSAQNQPMSATGSDQAANSQSRMAVRPVSLTRMLPVRKS